MLDDVHCKKETETGTNELNQNECSEDNIMKSTDGIRRILKRKGVYEIPCRNFYKAAKGRLIEEYKYTRKNTVIQ